MKKNWLITITDTATYIIKAESQEEAEDLAVEWFSERKPSIIVEETTEEEDYEIGTDNDNNNDDDNDE